MTRTITLPDGTPIELSERQATWMGLEPAADPACDGCVLFGCCVRHSSDTEYPDRKVFGHGE